MIFVNSQLTECRKSVDSVVFSLRGQKILIDVTPFNRNLSAFIYMAIKKKSSKKKITKKSAKKAPKKVSKKTAKKSTKKVAKKTAKKSAKKVAKKPAKKSTKKKVAKKAIKKMGKKTTKKSAKKTVKKTSKKVPVKKAAKKSVKKASSNKISKIIPPKKAVKKATKKAVKKVTKPTKKVATKKPVSDTDEGVSLKSLPKKANAGLIKAPDFSNKKKAVFKMTPFIEKQHKRLLDLRDQFINAIKGISKDTIRSYDSAENSATGMHQGDAGSDAYDRDYALSILAKEQDALYEIERAIHRIQTGSYGICQMSGERIPIVRLEVLPFARLTVECQTLWESKFGKKRYTIREGAAFTELL